MKSLYESLLDDFGDLSDKLSSKMIKDQIKQFLKANYMNPSKFRISKGLNEDGYYEVNCSALRIVEVSWSKRDSISHLTNNMFVFTNVRSFDCDECSNLISLEGAPKEVSKNFYCCECSNLTSLKGAPQNVGEDFLCSECSNLTSLEGAPQKVGRNFSCVGCDKLTSLEGAPQKVNVFSCAGCGKLTSLKGAPKEVSKNFHCNNCSNLTSLEGAPKEIGGSFSCVGCGKQFTETEVLKYVKIEMPDRIHTIDK